LGDAKTGGERGKGRHRRQDRFRVGEVAFEALHDFGEGKVAGAVIGDDVH
jgi:hypothetical protein